MCFSVAAMLAGFFAIIKAGEGAALLAAGQIGTAAFMMSAKLIMLSMILDGFDGNLARLLKGTSTFGGEFDTYVDIMSFGLAPALLAYWLVLKDFGFWGLLLASSIVLSGMLRLSRFRATDDDRGMKGYQGLPITLNAGWIALTTYICLEPRTGHFFSMDSGPFAAFVWACVIAYLVLQVSNFRYPKPTKYWLFLIPSAFFIAALFVQGMKLGLVCAMGMCIYGLCYAFLPPLFPRRDLLETEKDPVHISPH